jgi:tetratricopeptide (TPR) repeat protein
MNARIQSHGFFFYAPTAALAVLLAAPAAWGWEPASHREVSKLLREAERLVQRGDYQEAASECERASELAGGSCPECLLGVAQAYAGAGERDAAIQVTRMALPQLSTPALQARAYSQLAVLLADRQDETGAREAIQKALDLDPKAARRERTRMEGILRQAKLEAAEALPPEEPDEVVVQNGPRRVPGRQ